MILQIRVRRLLATTHQQAKASQPDERQAAGLGSRGNRNRASSIDSGSIVDDDRAIFASGAIPVQRVNAAIDFKLEESTERGARRIDVGNELELSRSSAAGHRVGAGADGERRVTWRGR